MLVNSWQGFENVVVVLPAEAKLATLFQFSPPARR